MRVCYGGYLSLLPIFNTWLLLTASGLASLGSVICILIVTQLGGISPYEFNMDLLGVTFTEIPPLSIPFKRFLAVVVRSCSVFHEVQLSKNFTI